MMQKPLFSCMLRNRWACMAFIFVACSTACYAYLIAAMQLTIDSLVQSDTMPGLVHVEWSAGIQSNSYINCIHIKTPSYLASSAESSFSRAMLSPFCRVDEVALWSVDGKVLETLAKCKELRRLDLRRLKDTKSSQWANVLRLPLTDLTIVDGDLPNDIFTHISSRNTLQRLVLAGNKPLDFQSLAMCNNIEDLHLEDIEGMDDSTLASSIPRLRRLCSVRLVGINVAGQTITALSSLKTVETIVIDKTNCASSELAHISRCQNLRAVILTRCDVNNDVLLSIAGIATIESCVLQSDGITQDAENWFRSHRPDVSLRLVALSRPGSTFLRFVD